MKNSTSKSTVITQVLLAVVAGALGYLLLFGKNMQVLTLCRFLCGGLIVVGIVSIFSYFFSGDFKRIDRFGFALGVMLILLGCIGFIQMDKLTANFDMYTGLLALILGVLTLQGTVQVKVLDYAVWVLNLVLTIISIAGAFCVLAEITMVTGLVKGFSNWVLIICGGSCLFSLIMTWICILLAKRRDKKAQKEAEAQAQSGTASQTSQTAETSGNPQVETPQAAAPAADPAPQNEFQPAESHHTGFDPADDLPPSQTPELVFAPSENHHTDFQPSNDTDPEKSE